MISLFNTEPWMRDGSCFQSGIGLADEFFPEKGGATTTAKQVCAGCPVLDRCRKFAFDNDIREGVWGGLSAHERDVMAGRRAA